MRCSRWFLVALATLTVFGLVILFLARTPILMVIGAVLVIEDEARPADVIHVMAETDDRVDHAIESKCRWPLSRSRHRRTPGVGGPTNHRADTYRMSV